jgi:predicted CopG family antitoxin
MVGKMLRIDDDVHAALTDLGKKNESYSDIIRRLIKFYKASSSSSSSSSKK